MKLLITISYLGSGFCGYQVQPECRTVQGELCRACRSLFGYECDVTGCSRTDSGVHANMFCATVQKRGESGLPTSLPPERVPKALSAHLPCDISVYAARWISEDFHPRHTAIRKEYIYRIYNSSVRSPFEEGRSLHYPKQISDEAFSKMQMAAKSYVGCHDFTSFMAQGSRIEDCRRTVYSSEVRRDGDIIEFTVSADGFLYNMVRIMVGTLLSVCEGKILPSDIEGIIESRDRDAAGATAPAHGLYLNRVIYEKEGQNEKE